MFVNPSAFQNTQLGAYALQALQAVINNPNFGTTVYHYQAQHADPKAFDKRGRPDYLSKTDPGDYATGIEFVENPNNPLRGVFCQAPRQPYQDTGGIYYTAQFELYLAQDPGEIFSLDDKYPKRQDKFIVQGNTYYAIAPAMPCALGATVGAWRIQLNVERYPVK